MKRTVGVAAALSLLVGAAACSSSTDSPDATSARAAKVTFIVDLTGPVSYAATPMREGIDFALDEARKSGELGDITIELSVEDSGSKIPQAVSLMSSAARQQDVVAVIQATGSGGALGTAPIAERNKLPMLNVQSSADGIVESGPHVYLSGAPPQELTIPLQVEYWKSQGASTIGVIYDSSVPTLKQFAEKDYPAEAQRQGMSIVASETISTDQTDFSSIGTKLAQAKPDAVLVGGQGPQNVRIITQLRQAGYEGMIGGTGGFAIGVQEPLGSAADKVTYPTDFSAYAQDDATKKFVANYKQGSGKDPVTFTAEGYNAARLLIESLKKVEGPITRESVQNALQGVMGTGFDTGAQGRFTYVERKARTVASLVQWDGSGGTTVVKQMDLGAAN